jgi:hypothetical protein
MFAREIARIRGDNAQTAFTVFQGFPTVSPRFIVRFSPFFTVFTTFEMLQQKKSVVSGQWSVVSGQWSVGSGQWAVGSGQKSFALGYFRRACLLDKNSKIRPRLVIAMKCAFDNPLAAHRRCHRRLY